MAGQPRGQVLLVEAPERLDGQDRGESAEAPALDALGDAVALLAVEDGAEGSEVQAEAGGAEAAEVVDGLAEGVVEQAVGVLAGVPAHQVEGVAVDRRGRDELAHRRRPAVRIRHDGQQQAGVARVEEPAEHHREAPLLLAGARQAHDGHEARHPGRIDRGRVEELDRVAVAGHAGVGLAEPLHLAALEREGRQVDHGLVAEVEPAHPALGVDRQPVLPGADHRHPPAVAVGEGAEG